MRISRADERWTAFVEQSTEGFWCYEFEERVPTDLSVEEQVARAYRSGRLVDCNDRMAQMYGYERASDLRGTRLSDLLPDDEDNRAYMHRFIASAYRLTDQESTEEAADGEMRSFLNNLVGTVEDGHLVRVWGTQRDITELRRVEAELRHAQKLEAVGRVAAWVAHDFNNMLSIILGYADLLAIDPRIPIDLQADILEVQKAADRAAALTRQLLALSRVDAGQPTCVDLDLLITAQRAGLAQVAGRRMTIALDLTCGASVCIDPLLLEQAVINLVTNARDASSAGSTIRILSRCDGRTIRLSVSDTGCGMD
nr:PAS domain S-box protein [Deltaproteobacteria bacterium]